MPMLCSSGMAASLLSVQARRTSACVAATALLVSATFSASALMEAAAALASSLIPFHAAFVLAPASVTEAVKDSMEALTISCVSPSPASTLVLSNVAPIETTPSPAMEVSCSFGVDDALRVLVECAGFLAHGTARRAEDRCDLRNLRNARGDQGCHGEPDQILRYYAVTAHGSLLQLWS